MLLSHHIFVFLLHINVENIWRAGNFDSIIEEDGDECGFLLLLFGGNDLNHFSTLRLDLCHPLGQMMLDYAKRSGR